VPSVTLSVVAIATDRMFQNEVNKGAIKALKRSILKRNYT